MKPTRAEPDSAEPAKAEPADPEPADRAEPEPPAGPEAADPEPPDGIDAEMVRYYAARADEYDDWYLRRGRYAHGPVSDAAWRACLESTAAWLGGRPFRGEIVELAAGTGWWSPALARKGKLTLYDAAEEPLALARARLEASGLTAEFEVRDAWSEPDRQVDGLFTGFWISHIDRSRLDEFFGLVARWLVPGGLFAFVDSLSDRDSGAADHLPPDDDVQVRRLGDGSTFRVRKIYYEPAELAAALARAGFDEIEVGGPDRFFVRGSARRQ